MPRQSSYSIDSPLASTQLRVRIVDLVAEYTLIHEFRNESGYLIEALFTFPIPLDAAFLGMTATLAGETLHAQIQPRKKAARTYEDALEAGDSAVLLEQPEPGVLTIGLGNLYPEETGRIELRFAAFLQVADRSARFSLPLVHRPRYGRWHLDALQTPQHDFAVEHPLAATIRIEGLLARAPVACSLHAARFAACEGAHEVTIAAAQLDRDLVLRFDLDTPLAPTAHLIAEGEATLGLVSFVLPMGDTPPQALDLCLVMDCSGSMNGDAIAQSRAALIAVAEALDEGDRIQVLRFGSTVVPVFRKLAAFGDKQRTALTELAGTLDSDLGGTEMRAALDRAIADLERAGGAGRSRAIILVTDGAVQAQDILAARNDAVAMGVRIFVVAVGSSAGTEVLTPLAEATGAMLERAVPGEPIDAGVMRQFRRARAESATAVEARWPGHDAAVIATGIAYPGDAIQLAARWKGAGTADPIHLHAPASGFRLEVMPNARTEAPAMRALLGQQRLRSAKREHAAIALQYGLLTRWTSAVLVKIREEKIDGEARIVQVPQMLPDGMAVGGSMKLASIRAGCVAYLGVPAFKRCSDDLHKGGLLYGRDPTSPVAKRVRAPASPPPQPLPARESGDLSLQRIRAVLQVFLRALLIRLDDVGTQDDFFATAMADLDADVRDDLHAVLRRSHIDCTDATLHPALLIGLAAALGETLPQAVIDLLEAAWQAGAAGARGVSLSKTAEVCELAFARALHEGETASKMTRLLRVFGMG